MNKKDRQQPEPLKEPEHISRPDALLHPEPEPVAEPEDDTLPIGIFAMDSAPDDGSYIFLAERQGDLFVWHECYWYVTRTFRNRRWQETGWWCERAVPRVKLTFEPAAWAEKVPVVEEKTS